MKLDDDRTYQILAGIAGAVVLAAFEDGVSWGKRVAMAFGGSCAATILAPALCELLGPSSPHAVAAISFILGLMGMSIVRAIIKFGQQRSDSVIGDLFNKIFGK